MDSAQADKIAQFSQVTGANPSSAQTALETANWNLEEAVALYFAETEDDPEHGHDDDHADSSHRSFPPQQEQPVVTPARRPPGQRPKQMTLQDLVGGRGEDDDDDDEDKNQDMFAGGEKSGLAVQNPNQGGGGGPVDHFRNIMNQARSNRERPQGEDDDDEEVQPRSNNFSGRAMTLGGDDVESRVIEDPRANLPQTRMERVTRTLHLWADGVSIDDGPLFRFDDPANQDMMAQINQGRAPLSLLDVQPNEEVELNLIPHKDENYVAPKKVYKPFSGSGQRLGAPTPGGASSSSSSSPAPAPSSSGTSTQQAPATIDVDDSAPTLQLQIRLGDGTRLLSRFNTTHTVGHVYEFVNRASSASTQRSYTLMTTFPSKELDDKTKVLGEMPDFKRGGVMVQKWT
ncbi:SEP-domain-containing protein [Acrodontium crateriforme]|uniref:SEP-domain-containing protein n=1 Tax=Acrodontium crateriforme TaxID=150365 RepID=A0AAQ3M2A2_9PEZI|nr:SEP-domain-containing protein [Acrodontium crateriforme]